MTSQPISQDLIVSKRHPLIGAEIRGVDLSSLISDEMEAI